MSMLVWIAIGLFGWALVSVLAGFALGQVFAQAEPAEAERLAA